MNINKLRFPWKPVDVQLGTISESACIGDYYQYAKFHACIKKCTICLKFRAMPPDYLDLNYALITCVKPSDNRSVRRNII